MVNILKRITISLLTAIALLNISIVVDNVYAQNSDVKVAVTALPENLDPLRSASNFSQKIFYNIYDGLFYTTKNGEIEGRLAEEWQWIDDTTFEVKIKENILFSNGEELKSDDVAFLYNRILEGDGAGTVLNLYSTLESVEEVDDYTVRFNLKNKDSQFLKRFSSTWSPGIIAKDYYEEVGPEVFANNPVGVGPYYVTNASPDRITLEKNNEYYGDEAPLDKIEFIVYPEATTRMTALISGEVDIAGDIPIDQIETVETYDDLQVTSVPIENVHVYVFNSNSDGIMSNQKFRQALTHAIDRKALIDNLWLGNASEMIGHQFPSYGDLFIEDYNYPKYDPELAKQLVEESGYDGETLLIQMQDSYYANGNEAGQAFVSMLADIGVNAKIEFTDQFGYNTSDIRAWSNSVRFDSPLGGVYTLYGPGSEAANPETGSWTPTDRFVEAASILTQSEDVETQRKAALSLLEEYDNYGVGTYLYQPSDVYGYKTNFEWDTYFVKNKITPFRLGDIVIK